MSSDPPLVVRRISGVDLRSATEMVLHLQRSRGNTATSEDTLRPAVQAALEAGARGLRALDVELGEGSASGAATHLSTKNGFGKIQRSRLHLGLA